MKNNFVKTIFKIGKKLSLPLLFLGGIIMKNWKIPDVKHIEYIGKPGLKFQVKELLQISLYILVLLPVIYAILSVICVPELII
jgi:hypothetical protein